MLHLSIVLTVRVQWAKKPGKLATVKFEIDPNVPRDDVYKSSAVHVPRGLPPNSVSRPTPRGRPAATPYGVTPYGAPSYASKPRTTAPVSRPTQDYANGYATQAPSQSRPSVSQASGANLNRVPPPPPPPPVQPPAPAEPLKPIYVAIYDFNGQTPSEMSFKKGDELDITRKEGNGNSHSSFSCVVLRFRMVVSKQRWKGRMGSTKLSERRNPITKTGSSGSSSSTSITTYPAYARKNISCRN